MTHCCRDSRACSNADILPPFLELITHFTDSTADALDASCRSPILALAYSDATGTAGDSPVAVLTGQSHYLRHHPLGDIIPTEESIQQTFSPLYLQPFR